MGADNINTLPIPSFWEQQFAPSAKGHQHYSAYRISPKLVYAYLLKTRNLTSLCSYRTELVPWRTFCICLAALKSRHASEQGASRLRCSEGTCSSEDHLNALRQVSIYQTIRRQQKKVVSLIFTAVKVSYITFCQT
jgi:hypothetical protein